MSIKKFTGLVKGVIVDKKRNSIKMPTIITVEYLINGNKYQLKDSVKLRCEAIKVLGIPIGMKKIPRLGKIEIGTMVDVMYIPEKPQKAKLKYNQGFINR